MQEIPYWLLIPYGFIETLAAFYFICTVAEIKISTFNFVVAATIKLFTNLAIKAIFPQNFLILALSSFIFCVLIIWIFTGIIGPLVWMATAGALFLIAIFEVLSGLIFIHTHNQSIYSWLLTGLPHILVLIFFSFIIRKVRKRYGQQTKTAT